MQNENQEFRQAERIFERRVQIRVMFYYIFLKNFSIN